ncbi:MAG: hypothetical protein LBH86_09690 [Oscillospiraceae bacterium]|jgi:putative ABC transport system permease protein|nr:hypothetical protein [Oscillospiraceae bacterium]
MPALKKPMPRQTRKKIFRYLSILAAIVLGVAFYAGASPVAPDMVASGESYLAKTHFYDIKLVSTVGFDDEDVAEISNLKGVQNVAPAYSIDVFLDIADKKRAFRVLSIDDQFSTSSDTGVNIPQITKGKYPRRDNECLVDDKYSKAFAIGQTLRLIADDETRGSLLYDEYIVSGYAQSPVYISEDRGSTRIGNGKLSGFILIPNASWNLDFYTDVYLTVREPDDGSYPGGSDGPPAVKTQEYTETAGADSLETDRLANASAAAQNGRSPTIFDSSYGRKIEAVSVRIQTLGETRAAARYAESEGRVRSEIDDVGLEISKAEEALAKAQEDIEKAAQDIANREKALTQNAGGSEEEATAAAGDPVDPVGPVGDPAAAEEALSRAQSQIDAREAEVTNGQKELDAGRKKLQETKESHANQETSLAQLKGAIDSREKNLEEQFKYMEYRQIELSDLKKSVDRKAGQDAPDAEDYEEERALLAEKTSELEQETARYSEATAQYDALLAEYRRGSETLSALETEIETLELDIRRREEALAAGREALQRANEDYQADLSARDRQQQTQPPNQTRPNTAPRTENAPRSEEASLALDAAKRKLAADRDALNIEKLNLDSKILESHEKIAAVEQRLAALDVPKWYVLNSSLNPGFSHYRAHIRSMRAIGFAAPALFFLAAAFFSLRAAGRGRGGAGGLRALRDTRRRISPKHIVYFLSASLVGSALGLILGLTLLPALIFDSYEMAYTVFPAVEIQFTIGRAVAAVILAVASTLIPLVIARLKPPGSLWRYRKEGR